MPQRGRFRCTDHSREQSPLLSGGRRACAPTSRIVGMHLFFLLVNPAIVWRYFTFALDYEDRVIAEFVFTLVGCGTLDAPLITDRAGLVQTDGGTGRQRTLRPQAPVPYKKKVVLCKQKATGRKGKIPPDNSQLC